jgi:hypothetical protein
MEQFKGDSVIDGFAVAWVIEVKGAKGKLTPAQTKFVLDWPGVVHIVRNVDDALRLVGVQA